MDTTQLANVIGYVASVCTSVSLLPQVITSFKTKHTKDVSLTMFVILFSGAVLWFIYGLLIKSGPVIITNAIVMSLTFTMVVLKRKYG